MKAKLPEETPHNVKGGAHGAEKRCAPIGVVREPGEGTTTPQAAELRALIEARKQVNALEIRYLHGVFEGQNGLRKRALWNSIAQAILHIEPWSSLS